MEQREAGWSALLYGKEGIKTLTLVGAVALHAINIYIVVTILPSIVRDIGGERYYSWAATIFMATSLLGATLAPKFMRKISPRWAYIIAALIFAIGTFICGFAHGMEFFLFGRLIQGLGGGFLLSLSYSMVRIVFPQHLWSRALGIISGMWGISTLLGPAIGGLFAEYHIWRASFWLVGILSVLFITVAYHVLPRQNTDTSPARPMALIQILLLIIVVLVISIASILDTTSAKIIGLAVGIMLFILLGFIDSTSKNKLLPTGSFSPKSPFFYIYSLMLILAISVNAAELYLPLFLQELHNEGPLIAGYLTALMSIGWTLGSITSAGAGQSRIKRVIVIAPIIALIGFVTLGIFIPSSLASSLFVIVITAALLLIGIGIGSSWPHILTAVLMLAQNEDADRASASLTTVQLYSTAISAALAGIITTLAGINTPGGVQGATSAAYALFIAIIILLLLGIPFSICVTRRITHRRPD